MKKLFYSLFMLAIMSLTFVAFEPKEPKAESNCDFFTATYAPDEDGKAMYVLEFSTNGLDIANGTGTGEYLVVMMYGEPSENGFPTPKTYNYIGFDELAYMETWEDCLMGGYPMDEYSIIGTFMYVIENDTPTDVLLCTDGTVTFEGNTTKGSMKANLEFVSGITGDIVEKEYIYNGAFNFIESKENTPIAKRVQPIK